MWNVICVTVCNAYIMLDRSVLFIHILLYLNNCMSSITIFIN